MKEPIKLAGLEFKSKKAAWDKCREILCAHRPSDQLSGDDLDILSDAFLRHPNAEEKLANGMTGITVVRDAFGSQGFAIIGSDGTLTEFSLRSCFGTDSPLHQVRRAFRAAITGQVLDFKAAAFRESPILICPVRGTEVTRDNCWIDHTPPERFEALLTEFMRARSLSPEKLEIERVAGQVGERRIVDDNIKRDWQEFHRANAKLRVVAAGVA